jgi:hypothetical protein
MRIDRILPIIALTFSFATVLAATASADSFDVSLNTSSLGGTQVLVFGYTDGDGVADNSATMSNFNFGGGSAQGSPTYVGAGASGSLSGSVVVNDTDFSSLFYQSFTVGSSLSFLLNVTNNFAGGTPDAFAMYVCDSTFSTCYSDDASTGADLLLNVQGTPLAPSSFILNPASLQNLPAPVVTVPTTTNVPEPSASLLLCAGLAFFALLFRANR